MDTCPRDGSYSDIKLGFTLATTGSQETFDRLNSVLLDNLQECWDQDIITVVPTGNSGLHGGSLDESTPQKLGTASNGLITVGGVDKDGVLHDITTLDAHSGGSISVYAMSKDVVGADYKTNSGSITEDGTSFAAPAVAGLAAYFASLPNLGNQWTQGSVATAMKAYIVKYAYVRPADPIANLPPAYSPLPAPDSIVVAYNRAPDGLCSAHLPNDENSPAKQRSALAERQDSSGDVPVVVSGTIVVTSLTQSYCYNTSFPTLPPASYCTEVLTTGGVVLHTKTGSTCTYNTVEPTTTKTPPPAPTINTDKGILTCGTRTDQGNAKYWFTLGDAIHARTEFCGNLTSNASPIVFKPGTDTHKSGIYIPPDNVDNPILVSAQWNSVGDSGCPTVTFSQNADDTEADYHLCEARLGLPIQDCKSVNIDTLAQSLTDCRRHCKAWT